jgi:hypothetical protein
MMRAALLLTLLSLTACESRIDIPGSVSAAEREQSNDAAAMLDANSVDANALHIESQNNTHS